MNTKLLLALISVAVFSSCTTMYKSGQTPDDVYYSPERTYGEGKTEERVERNEQYYSEDRAIRMGINDSRWRYLDNDYGYNVYYSPYNQYYSPYNYGFNHGYYYNPYFWPYPVYSPIFVAPSNPKVTTPRSNNLGGYGTVRGYNNAPLNPKAARTGQVRNYNNNNGSAVGNAIRRVMTTPSNNNTNNRTYTPSNNNNNNNNRTYTPSNNTSSSSSGSSSSGSSGGGISRPPRSGSK
jgi:hypothetical protein